MAGFIHQFKTPLHVIQSQVEFLLEDALITTQVRQSLEMMRQNTLRLSQQTQQLMEMARGTRKEMEAFPIEKLIADICVEAEVDCRKNNISLEKDISASAPVRMDTLALEGAIHNLVNNAIESMSKGGVLKIKTFAGQAHRIGIEIQDTGPGMNREELSRLRQPFQTSKSRGTGLGVYIARHVLKRHGGSVRWHSQPGTGTTVQVLLPVAA